MVGKRTSQLADEKKVHGESNHLCQKLPCFEDDEFCVRSDFVGISQYINTTNSAVDLRKISRNDCLRPVSWKDKKELVRYLPYRVGIQH